MPDDPIERHTQKKKTDDSKSESGAEIPSSEFAELSGFRRDCLIVISGLDTPKGLEVKEELEKYYSDTINHGRLYPNLDTLAEKGLIEKIEIDARSNGYILTELGRSHIRQRKQWEATCRDGVRALSLEFEGSSGSVDSTEIESSTNTRSKEKKPSDSVDRSEDTASSQPSPESQDAEDSDGDNVGDMTEELMRDLEDEL